MFHQAWTLLRDNFFDAKFNGVDWTPPARDYEPSSRARGRPTRCGGSSALMIGELNASHLGIFAPAAAGRVEQRPAGAALRSRPSTSPAAASRSPDVCRSVRPASRASPAGEYLVAVEGVALDRRRISTSCSRTDRPARRDFGGRRPAEPTREVVPCCPTHRRREGAALPRVGRGQPRVRRAASSGRLGYVHMLDMGAQSLNQLHARSGHREHARDGVVMDIRNNNGGFVNVYAIDVLARSSYFDMTPAGHRRRAGAHVLGPARAGTADRARDEPAFAVRRRGLHRGLPRAEAGQGRGRADRRLDHLHGNVAAVDGSIVRLPAWRVTARDGSDMEMRPRPVDVTVTRALGEVRPGRTPSSTRR